MFAFVGSSSRVGVPQCVLSRRPAFGKNGFARRVQRVSCSGKLDSESDVTPATNPPTTLAESAQQNGSQQKIPLNQCDDVVSEVQYPTEPESDPSLFPVRQPGNFPPAEVTKFRETEEEVEYDPLRDGPLRYLGYANELGEAFAAWLFSGGVPLSYAVAVGYVLFDTRDKGLKAYAQANRELEGNQDAMETAVDVGRLTRLLAIERAIDTVVWQLLASVIIPGYTIHTVVALVHYILQTGLHIDNPTLMAPAVAASLSTVAATVHTNSDVVATLAEKSLPTFAGLATIPFIVHPIDETVHAILNVSMRPALRKFLCVNGQGESAGLKICDETCMKADFPVLSEETNIIEAFTKSFEEKPL